MLFAAARPTAIPFAFAFAGGPAGIAAMARL